MFSFFRRQPKAPRRGQAAAAERARAGTRAADAGDPHVETIDEWFVRTARMLLRQAKPGAGPDGKRKSAHEQRIEALERANAALKTDNERLSSEVVALRTLLYPQGRER